MPERSKDFNRDRNYPIIREYKARTVDAEALTRFGAHGVGISQKSVAGKRTGQLGLVFYVTKKRSEADLAEREQIPKTITFTSRKDGRRRRIVTDVIETPPVHFEPVDPETRIRPVPGGVSGGISGSTGTIGGWVWDETDDSIVMLSNDHVFGNTAGTDILQQGTADGGSLPADKIGDVKRGIARTTTGVNTVDCSIGDPDNSGIYDLSVLEIGPAVYATATPTYHLHVEKYGQTTRHTFGRLIDVDYLTTVDGIYTFDDCLRIEPVSPSSDWSAGGDSGSLVFSQTAVEGSTYQPVVGLHFAGGGIYGVACKIGNVFSDLDLTTLCAGAFAAFLDSLFETETEGEVSEATTAKAVGIASLASRRSFATAPAPFTSKERRRARSGSLFSGISRDVQARLRTSRRGALLTNTVDAHRGELLTLLARDGDIRRATIAAVKPLVAGAVTTSEVLDRVLTDVDLARLDRLVREVSRRAGKGLTTDMKPVAALLSRAEGRSLRQVFQVKD